MSRSSSSTESQSSTASTNEDNRIVSESGGISVGKNAQYTTNDYFSDNVLSGFGDLVSLVKSAGEIVQSATNKAIDAATANVDKSAKQSQENINAVTSALLTDKAGATSTWSSMVPLLIGAVVLIVIFGMIFNRK